MDEKDRLKERKKRARKRKRKKIVKGIFITIAVIIVALAAFLITVKLCRPDYDLKSLLPQKQTQQVVTFVNEKLLGNTTTTQEAAQSTTVTTTKPPVYDYDEFEQFAFDTALVGNQMGNLLNGSRGAVTFSSSYIYYSIEGEGFYRFEPTSESNAALNTNGYNFKYLNVLGDYIYFIDMNDNTLYKSQITGGEMVTVCKGVSFVYLYNDKLFTIGTDNTVSVISTQDFSQTKLYTPTSGKTVTFAGISLTRVFFVEHDNALDSDEYITVSISDPKDKRYFREKTDSRDIKSLELEGGFMYYYQRQSDDSYNLVRQKFGSEQIVTLVENCTSTDYPVIYANRLYFLDRSGTNVTAKEFNMNTREVLNMVSASSVGEDDSIGIGYGYQYVFLFGTYGGDNFYRGSCIYTSSSNDNTLVFRNGAWHY